MIDWSSDVCSFDLGLPTSLQVVFCGDCPPRLSCGGGFGMAVRVVERLGPEHGAEHGEQAVGDGAQGTGMAMAALAQAAVFGAASGIALQGGQSPMIGDILEAAARSEEHTSELQSLMRISYAVFCLK